MYNMSRQISSHFFSNKSLKKSFSGILMKQAKTDEPVDSKYSTLEGLQ